MSKRMFGKTALVFAIIGALIFSALPNTVNAEKTGSGNSLCIGDVIIETGSTELFGGGDYISMKVRDIMFAVVYGNDTTPNNIILFSEYTRYFGGAEIYDNQGDFIGKRGIPVRTVFAQKFKFMFEFNDTDGNGLFDFKRKGDNELNITANDTLCKAVSLNRAWAMNNLTNTTIDNTTMNVDFKLTSNNVLYSIVWENGTARLGTEGDGAVEKIELYFHITVKIEDCVVQNVPWYNVTIDSGNPNTVTHSEWMRNETYTGKAVNATFKYDHLIQGWDFNSNNSKLALETAGLFGEYTPKNVNKWLRKQFGHPKSKYETHGGEEENNGTEPEKPVKLTRGSIEFDDSWYRIGKLLWVSDVTVDGVEENMTFQIHGGGKIDWMHGGRTFEGFLIKGAFIYPSGHSIIHDPAFATTALIFDMGEERVVETVEEHRIAVEHVGVGFINISSVETPPAHSADIEDIGVFANITVEGEITDARITVTYDDADIPANVDENTLRMYYYDPGEYSPGEYGWVIIENSGVYTENNTVWANVEHFTVFAVMGEVNTQPTLSDGGVTPSSGNTGTLFTYTVTYTDAENDPPSYIRVVIGGNAYSMSKQNPDDNIYSDGCIYQYQTTLEVIDHSYYFESSDGITSASTDSVTGPSVTQKTEEKGFIPGFEAIYLILLIGVSVLLLRWRKIKSF